MFVRERDNIAIVIIGFLCSIHFYGADGIHSNRGDRR
jgi:hypothetical protein